MSRESVIDRITHETAIHLRWQIDGQGIAQVHTGIPFLDHLLINFARHGLFDIDFEGKGDLAVDFHHLVEDAGITLGQALTKALGNKVGIQRYGFFYLPMDEALVRVVIDLSGRSYFAYSAPLGIEPVGSFSFQLIEEFLRAFSVHGEMNLHVNILAGKNAHHMAEAIFKALARALDQATQYDARVKDIPSTKGSL